jgi:hypothetical protein
VQILSYRNVKDCSKLYLLQELQTIVKLITDQKQEKKGLTKWRKQRNKEDW